MGKKTLASESFSHASYTSKPGANLGESAFDATGGLEAEDAKTRLSGGLLLSPPSPQKEATPKLQPCIGNYGKHRFSRYVTRGKRTFRIRFRLAFEPLPSDFCQYCRRTRKELEAS